MTRWYRLFSALNVRLVVRLALALVALGCLLRVGLGTRPGETEVARRHAIGKVASVDDYMAYGFWYGCLFTGCAAFVLLLTTRWWLSVERPRHVVLSHRDALVTRRNFWLTMAALLLLAAIPRVARMGQSFWGDEDWAYRDLVGGRFREAEDGSLTFKRHSWKVSAFWDKGTNNQYAYTLTARVFHDGWKRLSGAPPEAFCEAALRMPSLLAGLGSIVMGALLVRRMGYSHGALLFAALMAIHPWHVRYSSEARGYTMLVFFLLAGIYFLLAALEDGRWRWWLLFALFEFLSLYTWKAAVHPIAALNLGVLLVLLVKRRRDCSQYARWLVVNIGVLMLFVPLFAPAIPQIQRKLEVSTQAHGKMEVAWFRDVLAQLVGGADWVVLGGWAAVIGAIATVFIALGIRRMGAGLSWVLVVAPMVGAVLAFAHFSLSGNELLKWYVFYTLPFLLIPLAVGLERMRILRVIFLSLYFLLAFGVVKARVVLPIQNSRGAAELTRNADEGLLQMGPSDIVTVGLFRASHSYDPRMRQGRELRFGKALKEVAEECRITGKKLRVSAANLGFARAEHADFFEVLEDPKYFRKTGEFPAAEAYLEIVCYELVPGTAAAAE